jgi:hypothetical protein
MEDGGVPQLRREPRAVVSPCSVTPTYVHVLAMCECPHELASFRILPGKVTGVVKSRDKSLDVSQTREKCGAINVL